MRAVVIIYNGVAPSREQLNRLIEESPFIVGTATVSAVAEEQLTKLLVQSVRPPKLNTEDGDHAAAFIAGTVRDVKDVSKLTFDIITKLNDFTRDHSRENDAFVRACSIIAQRKPISIEARNKYGFNNETIEIITRLYQAWNNG